jgi:mannosyltransferase
MSTASAHPSDRLLSDPLLPRARAAILRVPEAVWVGAFLIVLCAVSVYVRTRYLGGQLWMDEAITIGISAHPLTAIPGILRMDGSPPLFYLALHIWMSMFGDGAAATHSLALVFGMLTVPVSYWGARSLFGRRAAVYAAVLFAFSAFLTQYCQETRMYSLMALLGLTGTIGLLQGFMLRRRGYVALFALSLALMLYTHAWALFYGAASVVTLALLWRLGDEQTRRHFIRDAVLAYIGAGVLFLPWLPNFIFQATHTGAPWDAHPGFGAPIQISRNVLGGDRVTMALLVPAVIGLAGLGTRRWRRTPEARPVWAMLTLGILTLAFAWAASQITPAWDPRYFAPMLAPMLLLFALGMSRTGILGAVALVLSVIFLFPISTYAPPDKSDMREVGGEMAPLLHRGALVIVGQPEQTPLAYYYLPAGLRFANTMTGSVIRDPTFMDWINALNRLQDSDPARVVPRLLRSVPVGGQVLFIRPLTIGEVDWDEPWTRLVRRRSAQWGAIIAGDRQLKPIAWAPHVYGNPPDVGDSAVLYRKLS